MSQDILGPGNADNAVTARPSRSITRGTGGDTFWRDCSSPTAADGTAITADALNDLIQQLRVAIDDAGVPRDGADDMLWRAMQSAALRYGVDTGSASALSVAFSPTVTTLRAGLPLLVKVAHNTTGATTMQADATAAKTVVWPDGTAIGANDFKTGMVVFLVYEAVSDKYQVLSVVYAPPQASGASFVRGQIFMWPLETPPTGSLECNGAAVSRTTFAGLFALIGTAYGSGNGTTTFNVPDYRGMFLRGWDHGAAHDPDRATRTDRGDGTVGDHVGTRQVSQFGTHAHTESVSVSTTDSGTAVGTMLLGGGVGGRPTDHPFDVLSSDANSGQLLGYTATSGTQDKPIYQYTSISGSALPVTATGTGSGTGTTASAGGNETRPTNVNILYCIAT